jgi:hypothetical protein
MLSFALCDHISYSHLVKLTKLKHSVIVISDRKISVSAETETEYSAEYSADTECSAISSYSVLAEYSVHHGYRDRN